MILKNRMMAEKKAEEMKVAVAEKHRILPHNELSINDWWLGCLFSV